MTGISTHQLQFMTAHQLKERSEMIVEKAHNEVQAKCKSKVRALKWVPPQKRYLVNSSSKPAKNPTSKPQEFKCCMKENQSKPSPVTQGASLVFVFGGSRVKETSGASEKCGKRTTKKGRRKIKRPSKRHPYVIRDQELKMEELERTQRKKENWRRQQ